MTCRRAAELISRELDASLPLPRRAGLGFHTLLCGACRRFRHQLGAIDGAVADALARPPAAVLPQTSKDHLRAVIATHLDEES